MDTDFPGPLIGDYKTTREAIREAYEAVLLGDASVDDAMRQRIEDHRRCRGVQVNRRRLTYHGATVGG